MNSDRPAALPPKPDDTLARLRRDYTLAVLDESHVTSDPLKQFSIWMEQAIAAGVLEPTAMALATVDSTGHPSVRTVLLKGVDSRGFTFFTNYESRKGLELASNPRVSVSFHWAEVQRQVCARGLVSKVSAQESEDYFRSRPHGSRLAAWVSRQSSVLSGRAELEQRLEEVKRRFPGEDVPLPPHWGGYVIRLESIEFWQGRSSRLHDRLCYTRDSGGGWKLNRLSP